MNFWSKKEDTLTKEYLKRGALAVEKCSRSQFIEALTPAMIQEGRESQRARRLEMRGLISGRLEDKTYF